MRALIQAEGERQERASGGPPSQGLGPLESQKGGIAAETTSRCLESREGLPNSKEKS